jgi:hypothetical protein
MPLAQGMRETRKANWGCRVNTLKWRLFGIGLMAILFFCTAAFAQQGTAAILNRPNFATPGPSQPTGPVIFAGASGVTPVSLYGAYSQAPNQTNEAVTATTTTSRQIQFALKVVF